jgi:hypothetical protein
LREKVFGKGGSASDDWDVFLGEVAGEFVEYYCEEE